MTTREDVTHLEIRTIQQIPLSQRHGKASDLFTVWFGTNIQLLTIATGGLAVSAFHLPFGWALLGLLVGNVVGAIFMALHAAQGPTLGVPQMVQTRGQFGSMGSLLVVGIVIVMYIGFLASTLVLGGQTIASLWPGLTDTPGIVLIAVLGVVGAAFGYDLIHAYARVMTWFSGVVLLLTGIWIVWVHGLPADFLGRNAYNTVGFLGTISVAALWQISYAPYVSDYSRYMPAETGSRPAFWASYWGCVLGSLLPMILGATVGLAIPSLGIVRGLAQLTQGITTLVLFVFTVGIAGNISMNLYCGALSTLTFGQTLVQRWAPGRGARTVICVILGVLSMLAAMLGKGAFMANYEQFILFLLYVLVPWTAINLVDYYLLQHGVYDVASFFRRDGGIYGWVNGPAVFCYILGAAVQLPFAVTELYTGPVARAMGGIDLSWIVGLIVTAPAYYLIARRFPVQAAPAAQPQAA
jgi:NCS1 family nucleobase:cation symporter-1